MLDWLKDILGEVYTEDIDKKVSAAIGKDFVSRSDFNAKNEAYKALESQIAERDRQLEELKKVDAAGLQEQITRLQGENQSAKESYEKQIADMKLDYALDAALIGKKAKNPKAVKGMLAMEDIKLDGDKLLGLDTQLESLLKSDSYLFDTEDASKGSGTFTGSSGHQNHSGDDMAAVRAIMGLPTKT